MSVAVDVQDLNAGLRELLKQGGSVTITDHGTPVGTLNPARAGLVAIIDQARGAGDGAENQAKAKALMRSARAAQELVQQMGMADEELLEEFEASRRAERQARRAS
jgi:antitoxin (DNA-binding transcriptional repressor) of toxin-antitoxin stability system